jgi:enoyl-CoA hydratase/carnithine racemase
MSDTVTVERDGRVSKVILNRPNKLNAINQEMVEKFRRTMRELSEDEETQAIVLMGAGDDAFCAGVDMEIGTAHSETNFKEFLESDPGLQFEVISDSHKPVICAVQGWAIGMGLHLALRCDVIYATRSSTFKIPQVELGVMPGNASLPLLARHMGQGNAAEMALFAEPMDGEEAYQCGLVQDLFSSRDELMEHVMKQAHKVADMPSLHVRLAKESLQTGQDIPLSYAQLMDSYRMFGTFTTDDRRERHAEEQKRHN